MKFLTLFSTLQDLSNDIEWIVEKEEGVNLEANGFDKDLSQKNIIKKMLNYLEKSTIDMIETPEGFLIGDRKLFILKYNMEGFIPYAYFAVDLKNGEVELIQIDDQKSESKNKTQKEKGGISPPFFYDFFSY